MDLSTVCRWRMQMRHSWRRCRLQEQQDVGHGRSITSAWWFNHIDDHACTPSREENWVRTGRMGGPVRTPSAAADWLSGRPPRDPAIRCSLGSSAAWMGARLPHMLARLVCCTYSVSSVTNSNCEPRLKLVNIFYYSNQMHVHVHQCA
jgi:hypothetical protein